MQTRPQAGRNGRPGNDPGQAARRVHLDHAGRSAAEAWTHAREAVTDLREALDLPGRAQRHPYGTVAAALGMGYVLGGGLFTRLTARIVGLGFKVGLRLAVIPMIEEEILDLAQVFTSPAPRSAEVGPPAST